MTSPRSRPIWDRDRVNFFVPLASSNDSTIGAQHLAIDPGTIRSGEESDGAGDVLWPAEALERRKLGKVTDDTFCFIAASRKRVGQHAWRDLPGNSPLVFAPPALALLPAITDNCVLVAVRHFR